MPKWGWWARFDPEGAFWGKVDKSGGPDACWPWMAAEDRNGYGAVKWQGKKVNVHRVALELKLGRPIAPGMDACHTRNCTTRLCCNPSHLYEGTRKQNVADSLATGTFSKVPKGADNWRGADRRGEMHPNVGLTEAQVVEIDRRLRAGERHGAIAAAVGVKKSQVKDVSAGRAWGWLTGRSHK